MNQKKYPYCNFLKVATLILLTSILWDTIKSINQVELTKVIFLFLGSSVIFILAYTAIFSSIIINDRKICYKIGSIVTKYSWLDWEEVGYIIDDHFLCWHFFHVRPNEKVAKERNSGIMVTNFGMKNHKDLLTQIILYVKPNTKIDETILKRVNLTQEDIGKNFGKPIE